LYRLPAAGTADLQIGGFNVGPDGSPANKALANRSLHIRKFFYLRQRCLTEFFTCSPILMAGRLTSHNKSKTSSA
jgi:hypothetical protein